MKPCHIADISRCYQELISIHSILSKVLNKQSYGTSQNLYITTREIKIASDRLLEIFEYEIQNHSPHNIKKDKEI